MVANKKELSQEDYNNPKYFWHDLQIAANGNHMDGTENKTTVVKYRKMGPLP